MKVRIFSALTMQEAMNQVKEAMGRDAVILHTRKFRKGGIGGFFGHEMIEVMAAVDDAPTTQEPKKQPAKSKTPVRPLVRPDKPSAAPVVTAVSAEEKKVVGAAPAASPSFEPLSVPKLTAVLPENAAPAVVQPDSAAIAENERPALEKLPEKPAEAAGNELKNELTGMRQMLEQILSKTKTIPDNPWYDYLIKKEITPIFAEHVLKGFPHALAMLNKNPDATKKMLYDRLIGYIRPAAAYRGQPCHKVALVGPTGVGKTTTLAKLAARFTLEQNASVAFITSDTYRIAAVEQLKTYANILNVPLDVVYSPDEMKKCLNRHKDKQLVLIDTAGRSQYNDEQIMDLKQMLAIDDDIDAHLVLSANTTYQETVEIIERFSSCFSDKVIFTKLDETRNIGNVFNVMYHFGALNISYITDGQSVPDDIHIAEPGQLTNMLLRD